jgi:hypothetical protein
VILWDPWSTAVFIKLTSENISQGPKKTLSTAVHVRFQQGFSSKTICVNLGLKLPLCKLKLITLYILIPFFYTLPIHTSCSLDEVPPKFILFYFCNEPMTQKKKKKLCRLPIIEGFILKYKVPPLWSSYVGERRTTFAKALHIVKDVGMKWSFPSIRPVVHPSIRPVMVCLLRRGGENSGIQTQRSDTVEAFDQVLKKFQIKKE